MNITDHARLTASTLDDAVMVSLTIEGFTGRAVIEENDEAEQLAIVADVRTGIPSDTRCQRAIVEATADLLSEIRDCSARAQKAMAIVRGIRTEREHKTGAVSDPHPKGYPFK